METTRKTTGLIYCRVSSQEQVSGTSLAMQERLCREYAARHNIEIVVEPFIEKGESAKTVNRTEFKKAIALCADKKKPIDYFIVHKIDRFARNQGDHAVTQTFLRKCGTKLRSVVETIDETPIGKAMEGLLAVFAELDNNVRSERSKAGMMEKVRQGVWVWAAPIGYKRLVQGGNLVIDEEYAPYVRMAFERYATGTVSFKTLADELHQKGFRTKVGKKAYPQLIEAMIHNSLYVAIMKVGGVEATGLFPAIVDEDLFRMCQKGFHRKFAAVKREPDNPSFPLRRFTVCARCERSLTGSFSRGRNERYPYYHHQTQKKCDLSVFIPKEIFEEKFFQYLQKLSPTVHNEKLFRAVVMDVWQSSYKRLDADNARARQEIENLESDRQKIFELHRAGKYTDQEFFDQKDLINNRILEKRSYLEDKWIEEFNMDEALEYCFKFVRESGKTWKRLEKLPVERIRFQKNIFPEKVTYDGEKFGTAKIALVYKANGEKTTEKSDLVTSTGFEPVLTD